MGYDVILQATNKAFPKEGVKYLVHSEIQLLKSGDIFFHYTKLFKLRQIAQMMCFSVKAFIKVYKKLGPRNIPSA